MRMKTVAKLQNDILLNIQYFRLKEEISETENKIEAIKEKNNKALLGMIGQTKKKLVHNQNFIATVNNAIKSMEANNKKYDLSIIDKNLAKLKELPNYNFIAHQIAVCTALDITVPYCNTDDYLENISYKLFGDRIKIAFLTNQRNKIMAALNNNALNAGDEAQKAKLKNGAQIILNNPIMSIILKGKFPNAATTIVSVANLAINYGVESGSNIINKIQGVRKFKKLNADSLDYVLLTNLLLMDTANSLRNEKELSELDYQKFFVNKMEVIGRLRQSIQNELYHKWKDRDENIKKMNLLYSFDNYVIKHLIPQK